MNFRKVNNITGWVICIIACITYIMTAEATASLWDTGEFIASAYKLQPPHPPGAPLFALLGRIFIVLFGGFTNPAFAVNMLSALASGFTILFLFWTITHFARKMFVTVGEHLTAQQTFTVMAAGVVGALAYTFSDTFWYSAVEGEVYALSSFFTALVFWAMLKWEHADEHAGLDPVARSRADRWIVFIFFMIGLSIGVHLLNLLTIPPIVMIYYFRRYTYSLRGAFVAFAIACVLTLLTQVAVIQWLVKIAGRLDVLFVNDFNLPFFSGFAFFYLLVAVLIWLGLRLANRRGWSFLRLGLWCFTFVLVGFSMYMTTMIRSNADPAMDMNNVDNPMTLVRYLARDQYGRQPLLYGPHFAADYRDDDRNGYIDIKETTRQFAKGRNGKYVDLGRDIEPLYEKEDMMFFPRVWDRQNEQSHADFYAEWLGLGQFQDPRTGRPKYEDPSYSQNISWFFSYQMGLMYWRYFMWNFSGKQNDIQGLGNKMHGNWITGISFIDSQRFGDDSEMPASMKDNKANNKLFMLPFLIGILGAVYQFLRNGKDWLVTFLLFFMTGIAIAIYLNMPGNQPRERDYAFVGSFYAFAIWIGLAVVAFFRLAKDNNKQMLTSTLIWGGAATFLITLMSCAPGAAGPMLMTSIFATALYIVLVMVVNTILRAISNKGANERLLNIGTAIFCILIPLIMVSQEWNDHDRSEKTIASDNARNYLESCAPNAILFTFGDNDTYPLWYAQEVEGVRPDIRIINTSLLGIDWYINQLRYKVNQSDSVDVIWTPEQIQGANRQYLRYNASANVPKDQFFDLYDVMKNVLGKGDNMETFPVRRFSVPVDTALVRKNGTVNADDVVYPQMLFELPQDRNDLGRDQLIILNIIATNGWRRPIYFTNGYGTIGFGQYLRKDGLTYRLIPAQLKFPQQYWTTETALRNIRMGGTGIRDNNIDWMYKVLMTHFKTGNAQTPGVYFDEENKKHVFIIRSTFAELAGNMADLGRKDEAKKLMERAEQLISTENLPYAQVSRYNGYNQSHLVYLEAAYKAGMNDLAEKVRVALKTDLDQQKAHYNYLRNERDDIFETLEVEDDIVNRLLIVLDTVVRKYAPDKAGPLPQVPGASNPPVLRPDSTGQSNTRVDSNQ